MLIEIFVEAVFW